MERFRTILWVAAGLAVFILACGQDARPTAVPVAETSVEPAAEATVRPAAGPTENMPIVVLTIEPAVEIQVGSSIYEIESIWGNTPASGVSFASPNGIAIDSFDNVYVTEFRGNRVQKFSPDGVLLTGWGSAGTDNGQFRNPTGIAIDGEGNVYVSESGNNRVQKFTAEGEWLASSGM